MAITRAQQAKQMLQDGGRIGFQGGGRDAATESFAQSIGGQSYADKVGSQFGFQSEQPGGDFRSAQEVRTQIANRTQAEKDAIAKKERERKQRLAAAEKARVDNLNFREKRIKGFIDRSIRKDLYRSGFATDEVPLGIPTSAGIIAETAYSIGGPSVDAYDVDSVREIASVLSTTTPEGISASQASALGNLRSNLENREELLNSGMTQDRFEELYPGPKPQPDGDGPQPIIPIIPNAGGGGSGAAEEDYYADVGGNPFLNREAYRFYNKGGIADTVVGGEFDFESARQMYGLGKLVKKVGRTVKKIAKSPIGKAAILGAVGFGIPGTSFGGLLGRASFGGAAKGLFGTYGPVSALKKIGLMKTQFPGYAERVGPLSKLGPMSGIFAASALAGLMTPKTEDEEDDEDTYRGEGLDFSQLRPYGIQRFSDGGSGDLSKDPNYKGWVKLYEKNPDIAAMNDKHQEYLNFYERDKTKEAEGSKEPVAKKTMPLLDMGGQEMDLRAEGGFVPIGRMEKADDVPARLSKNEFVFTADAVRNAGDGDVDKGAEVMYNMMKNLESGGDVSKESQGLEGARKMFQTSQRLEEVL